MTYLHKVIIPIRLFITIIVLILLSMAVIKVNPYLLNWETDCENPLWSGSGRQNDPFLIRNLSDLIALRDSVNAGNSFEGCYFLQTTNIDLGKNSMWIPIGEYGSGNYFYGVYDGGSNYICNLNFSPCETITSSNGGFFGILGGQVMNLGIESGQIEGDYVGSIASHSIGNHAAIINCYNKAVVVGNGRGGGICDNFTGGSIINCINYGNISAAQSAQIVSYNADYVINTFPIDNAVTTNFQGTYANYITLDVNTTSAFLNEGIRYLYSMNVFLETELKYWGE